ncbi:MAG: TlpA family protein disulfide reductase [Bacteroidales bacterium]|nr:TlpA family protein disulfide reductase [Bacteroidales bacterium]
MKKIFPILAAVIVTAACTNSSRTIIKGTFVNPDKVSESVHIWFDDESDTTVTVDPVSASFQLELPANPLAMCSIQTGLFDENGNPQSLAFISEGGTINFKIDSDDIVITASKKNSPTLNLRDYSEKSEAIIEEYGDALEAIGEDAEDRDAQVTALEEKISAEMNALALETASKNRDNILGPLALSSADLEENELYEQLLLLDKNVQQQHVVAELISTIESRIKTIGQPFIDFTVVQDPDDPEGSTVSLSDYVGKGKYILVDFWASWCGPCRREIPNIRAVWEKYAGENFDVLSVAVWDDPEASKNAIAELGIDWNNIINAGSEPTGLYSIEGIPHLILFAPDGTVLKRNLRGAAIEATVAEYLGK